MNNFIQNKAEQLEILLDEIRETIDKRIEIGNIDLDEYDNLFTDNIIPEEMLEEKHINKFRETIVFYKNDNLFYSKDIPRIESLLSNLLNHLESIKNNKTESNLSGDKIQPNPELIKLVEHGLLNITSPISGNKQGKIVSGFLTKDGFLEIEINGITKKFGSLRRAAISAWGSDVASQWKFWKVNINTPEEQTLEYYKKLLPF